MKVNSGNFICVFFNVIIFIIIKLNFSNATPLFFSNPFAPRTANVEIENISIYTTTERTSENHEVTHSPNVYHQIFKNILERLSTPITEKPSKLIRATTKTSKPIHTLEIVDDAIEFNSTKSDLDDDEEDTREAINPNLIDSNPSFKMYKHDDSKPERYVVETISKKLADGDSMENEIDSETMTREIDNVDETTTETHNSDARLNENGLVMLLEYIASAITLTWGAISSFFPSRMDT